ncbi:MAG: YkgJ family cysteine cluster protein [Candidatus Hodarchaeota archaeon]
MMKFKCEKCACCCNDPSTIVTVTHHDIRRITKFLNIMPQQALRFLAFYCFEDDASAIRFVASPPIHTIKGDSFLGLLKEEDGKCIFLKDSNKCLIYPARPMTCRAFPFTFDIKDGWLCWGVAKKAKYCKGLNKGKTVERNKLDRIGSTIIGERADFTKIISIWNNLAKARGIRATPELLIEFISKTTAVQYARR